MISARTVAGLRTGPPEPPAPPPPVRGQPPVEVLRPRLLLALEDETEVDRQPAAHGQPGRSGGDEHVHGALVVRRAPGGGAAASRQWPACAGRAETLGMRNSSTKSASRAAAVAWRWASRSARRSDT